MIDKNIHLKTRNALNEIIELCINIEYPFTYELYMNKEGLTIKISHKIPSYNTDNVLSFYPCNGVIFNISYKVKYEAELYMCMCKLIEELEKIRKHKTIDSELYGQTININEMCLVPHLSEKGYEINKYEL